MAQIEAGSFNTLLPFHYTNKRTAKKEKEKKVVF
jgi:hypothetical protein